MRSFSRVPFRLLCDTGIPRTFFRSLKSTSFRAEHQARDLLVVVHGMDHVRYLYLTHLTGNSEGPGNDEFTMLPSLSSHELIAFERCRSQDRSNGHINLQLVLYAIANFRMPARYGACKSHHSAPGGRLLRCSATCRNNYTSSRSASAGDFKHPDG